MEDLSVLIENSNELFKWENSFNNRRLSSGTIDSESGDSYYANANWFGNLEPLKAPEGLRKCGICRGDIYLVISDEKEEVMRRLKERK